MWVLKQAKRAMGEDVGSLQRLHADLISKTNGPNLDGTLSKSMNPRVIDNHINICRIWRAQNLVLLNKADGFDRVTVPVFQKH